MNRTRNLRSGYGLTDRAQLEGQIASSTASGALLREDAFGMQSDHASVQAGLIWRLGR
jgi:hypothetical protein